MAHTQQQAYLAQPGFLEYVDEVAAVWDAMTAEVEARCGA
jgi:hypothetical protein